MTERAPAQAGGFRTHDHMVTLALQRPRSLRGRTGGGRIQKNFEAEGGKLRFLQPCAFSVRTVWLL